VTEGELEGLARLRRTLLRLALGRGREREWAVRLADTLAMIREHDADYEIRERLVWQALDQALKAGLSAGVAFDPGEPNWPVVYLDLPTGQVSWHQPMYGRGWDGHTTDEKYRRIDAYVASQRAWAEAEAAADPAVPAGEES